MCLGSIMNPLIRCGFGIGNRVATMANALSRHDQIRFVWRENAHAPLPHDQVFPQGIPGVEFITEAPRATATRWQGNMPGSSWEAAEDRQRANAAYLTIMEAMAGAAHAGCASAIIARFHRHPAVTAASLVSAVPAGPVFILADSRREELRALLQSAGHTPVLPTCPPMCADQDRSATSLLAFLSDWKTALSARHIVTHLQPTSLCQPALAAGKSIIFPLPEIDTAAE